MQSNQFQTLLELDQMQNIEVRPRMRSYHMRIKNKRLQLEDYEFRQIIGEGGFGKVKKAVHKLTGQLVAVKVCSIQEYDPQSLTAIEQQVQIQKTLMHENIAQIYEVIKKDSKIYIFMEYCKNGELFDKINKSGPLHQKEAAKIFNQILSALLYLKQNSLSHRDIKPQNVLFDQHWNVKLIDFGFSCTVHPGEFRKTCCGTPSYTPPQIIRKVSYDAELADVWSLGVTLYAMLAAQLPFEGETNQKRKANILAFKYALQPSFSNRAQKLIASIFVDAKHRPRLLDLKNSQFSWANESIQPHFIDFRNEELIIQKDVIDVIDKDYHVDPQKVVDSVINHKFDKYHALYYLTIKNQKHTHRHIHDDEHLDEFKKRRKGSLTLLRLNPIANRTPSNVGKNNSLKINKADNETFELLKPNLKLKVVQTERKIRKNSQDIPKIMMNHFPGYKEY